MPDRPPSPKGMARRRCVCTQGARSGFLAVGVVREQRGATLAAAPWEQQDALGVAFSVGAGNGTATRASMGSDDQNDRYNRPDQRYSHVRPQVVSEEQLCGCRFQDKGQQVRQPQTQHDEQERGHRDFALPLEQGDHFIFRQMNAPSRTLPRLKWPQTLTSSICTQTRHLP